MSDEQKQIIAEQRGVLDLALSSAHLSLDLIEEVRRLLLLPLAALDLGTMADEDVRIVAEDAQKSAKRFIARIEFALTAQVAIHTDARLEEQ